MKKLHNYEVWLCDCIIRLYLQPSQRVAELFCSHSSFVSRLMVDAADSSGGGGGAGGGGGGSASLTPGVSSNPFALCGYLGVDSDYSGSRAKWLLRDAPFPAEWIAADPARDELMDSTDRGAAAATPCGFDLLVSFKSLTSKSCASGPALSQLFRNASRLLRPGGVFAGTCHDATTLWYKINKKERESGGKTPRLDKGVGVLAFGPGYRIDFPQLQRSHARFDTAQGDWDWDGSSSNSSGGDGSGDGSGSSNQGDSAPAAAADAQAPVTAAAVHSSSSSAAGGDPYSPALRFWLQVTDASGAPSSTHPPLAGALLHVPSLVAVARAHGFELLHMTNYSDFFAEHGASAPFAQTAHKLSVLVKGAPPGQLTPAQLDFYSLFAIFAFRKMTDPATDSGAARG